MVDPQQLRDCVVRPVLKGIDAWSVAAERLLLITAMQESRLTYLKQIGKGPALSLWQIEPATHQDLWTNWLRNRPILAKQVLAVCSVRTPDASPWYVADSALVYNIAYACAIARLLYRRVKVALPDADDLAGLAGYWKTYYNTPAGAGTPEQFVQSAARFPPGVLAA